MKFSKFLIVLDASKTQAAIYQCSAWYTNWQGFAWIYIGEYRLGGLLRLTEVLYPVGPKRQQTVVYCDRSRLGDAKTDANLSSGNVVIFLKIYEVTNESNQFKDFYPFCE